MQVKWITSHQAIHNLLVGSHGIMELSNLPMPGPPIPWWMIEMYMRYKKLLRSHNNMFISPTLQYKYICHPLTTLLYHHKVIQVMVYMGNNIRFPCITMIPHHLINHPYQPKWEHLMIIIGIHSARYVCHHNKLYPPKSLHLSPKSTIKVDTFLPLMVLLESYKPISWWPTLVICHPLIE